MDISLLTNQVDAAQNYLAKKDVLTLISQLETEVKTPDFWDTPKIAQQKSSQLAELQKIVKTWQEIKLTLNNLIEIAEILSAEEMETELEQLSQKINQAKIELWLSGKYDNHNAIITLTVGAGGVDANDWTEMVMTMLLKYCDKKKWRTEVLDLQTAETAGIKGATIRVSAKGKIYGYLKSEAGTHRLVRRSPFNAGNTRETSFANVEIVPEIEDSSNLNINDKDLRVDTYRAQGAGGQHVNTTDSAVRITHIPSGIVVQCQNERSQLQNKIQAMKVLTSRLAEKIRQENELKQKALKSNKVHASFGGGHIRSYVLDDQYVKDQRTGLKTSQTEKVLQGELDPFIEAFIVM
jgi:peptide chain release factor 2